uniref:ISXO2-like transposase domain-containing protein n=1 Tax=Trichuris muris TaxID=70415 RepID=A0A5S6Q5B5_TRIMR
MKKVQFASCRTGAFFIVNDFALAVSECPCPQERLRPHPGGDVQRQAAEKNIAVRSGTWCQGSKLPLRKIVQFLYAWSKEYTTCTFCVQELDMAPSTAVQWNLAARTAAAQAVLRNPVKIGGPGLTVEVDESLFSRRKYNRGQAYPQQWVFGGVCRETGECFLVEVPDRSSATLIPVIKDHIWRGTTVVFRRMAGIQQSARRSLHALACKPFHQLRQPGEWSTYADCGIPVVPCQAPKSSPVWNPQAYAPLIPVRVHMAQKIASGEDPFDKILCDIATHCPPE